MEKIINDFTVNIATANGTGSQSANLIFLNSLFRMGTHASGKNLFPSNISGLPTWYIVRISDKKYQAPGDKTHIQILMNKIELNARNSLLIDKNLFYYNFINLENKQAFVSYETDIEFIQFHFCLKVLF